MLNRKTATVAIALTALAALASPVQAGRISHDTTDIILAQAAPAADAVAETIAEADRVELVAASPQMGEMSNRNSVAVAAPAPAALAVFGIGLLGLAAARHLRRR